MGGLRVEGLRIRYGAVEAIKGVDLVLEPGEIRAILGSNGAGKSSILKAIMGMVRLSAGQVTYGGVKLTGMEPNIVLRQGIALVPEGRGILARLTVKENLLMGGFILRDRAELARNLERMYARFPWLREREGQVAGTLSGGEQQMLSIARGLMSSPKLLLLDEPSLGLAPIIVEEVFQLIREIHGEGTSILLVEQNAVQALRLASWAYVLETGSVYHQGPAEEGMGDARLREAYLGG